MYGVRVREEAPAPRKGISAETTAEIKSKLLGIPDPDDRNPAESA